MFVNFGKKKKRMRQHTLLVRKCSFYFRALAFMRSS